MLQGGQHPKVWIPMESPKGLAMEGSLVTKKKSIQGKHVIMNGIRVDPWSKYGSLANLSYKEGLSM